MNDSSVVPYDIDGELAKCAAMPDTQDALVWLGGETEARPRHLAACESNAASVEYVKAILGMGAVSVQAVANNYPLDALRTCLTIELPDDPEVRKRLYDWNVEVSYNTGTDARYDMGTTHMLHIPGYPIDEIEDWDDDEE